ncbi:hypothetical protein JKF63_02241 [Porcisia hertigi]|uniref:Phosphoglycerate mutase n=1 Tax=Porcisia hertigi TaxID=2761500 RepID=A0A836L1I3_9TRYP|nr:hypothetical protein JKF63_02241 [Porcisia hertigi]
MLTSPHRCVSSSGFSKEGLTPTHPRSASPPVRPDTGAHVPEGGTEEDATPDWVLTRKPNGVQRMSISIRSSSHRHLARRQQSTDLSGTASLDRGASTPATRCPSGVDQTSGSASSSPAPTKQKTLSATTLASTDPSSSSSSCTAAQSPLPTARGSQRHHDSNKSIQNTEAPAPTPPTSASSGASRGAGEPSPPPSTALPSRTGAPHSLLYSVSSFAEPVKRIILIRNGRSEANEDVSVYVQTPDWRIPLVEEGKREAIAAGRALSELIGDDPVYFYYSPYIRSRQSLRYLLQGFDEARLSGLSHTQKWWEEEESTGVSSEAVSMESLGTSSATGAAGEASKSPLFATATSPTYANLTVPSAHSSLHRDPSLVLNSGTSSNIIGVREDVRLRDGDIGRYTSAEELMQHLKERERYGRFFYRFPFGESGADVCDRVTSFLDAFQRERVEFPMDTNVVIITHGLTMRMFIKRWFYLTVETFHKMRSPPPGSLCTLTRLHHRTCFRLDESCVELMNLPLSLNEFNGYKYRNKQLLGSMSCGAPYM